MALAGLEKGSVAQETYLVEVKLHFALEKNVLWQMEGEQLLCFYIIKGRHLCIIL